MKKILLAISVFTLLAGIAMGQEKYGHLNFGNLISAMPATKTADSDLEAYQKQLIAKGEDMAKSFQEQYSKFVADVQSGTLAPVKQQEMQTKLQEEQQKLMQYDQEIRQKVQAKRTELLEPIVAEAEKAISEVAKENGYVMIFDSSVFNAILYTKEADDILDLVKAKLGLN